MLNDNFFMPSDQVVHPPHILVGVSGSVASIKAAELVSSLSCLGEVRLILTDAAKHFVDANELSTTQIYYNENEWETYQKRGDPVLHIELRRWADIFLIAPLSANSLAKLSYGISDNLLTCTARAWQTGIKPLVIAPAMNTAMWDHPVTTEHISRLTQWGVHVVPPVEKTLICGDAGMGAMANIDTLVDVISKLVAQIFE
uniref:Flavoprotein domain-containing protein n=1 Tax=Spongospora subterranea TaxID=70186 RepID=A0A0H5QH68_9EUKA|eukprot:CRZ00681.1 hypothetical protein [Spongospora subterranea]